MAEQPGNTKAALAEPKIQSGFNLSPIWLLPIIALGVGGWLVYQTISQKGPAITISFKSAEGLEEGKTKIKFREVEIGLVNAISIKPDLSGVTVSAEMEKEATAYLTDATRFWVVRPRLGAKGVSGLGTLLSGAFIEIDPGKGGESVREFIGLEVPPVITTDQPGKEFILLSERLGSYTTGSPVYYRGLEVGEVLGYEMRENRKEFQVHVFLHAPYDQLVRDDSRFWNVSGINVSLDSDGMELSIESLQALVLGGIAFDTPSEVQSGESSKAGTMFRLHDREEDVEDALIKYTFRWILYFDGSVRGLNPGAPVEFKGIKVGTVVDINLEFKHDSGGNHDSGGFQAKHYRIPVLIDIEPERISVVGEGGHGRLITRDMHLDAMRQHIDGGLRARLISGNLITGQLLIDLDFHPKEKAVLRGDGAYPEIPTIPSKLEEITHSLTEILDKIAELPLGELTMSMTNTMKSIEKLVNAEEIPRAIKSLDETLLTLKRVMNNVDRDLLPIVASTLSELDATAKTIREAVSPESPLRYDLDATLRELATAARSIRLLAEYLERNPNALIYGKGGGLPQ